MKNKLIALTALISGLSIFFVSEYFYTELILINVTFSLLSFLFLPYIIGKIVELKYHFSSIYLAYLGLYITVTFLAQILGLNIYVVSNIIRILVVMAFLVALYFYAIKEIEQRKDLDIRNLDYKYPLLLVAGLIVALFINFVVIRQANSIVALDLLQHQSVVNQVYSDLKICLFPSQCNNLFLKDGYTTLYHSIQFFVSPTDSFIDQRIYTLDIAWLIISAVSIFIFAKKFIQNKFALALATFVALLTFVNGAYEFSFFIPQGFVFFIFLISYTKEKLDKFKLGSLILILVLTHFIIGAYLAFFLLVLEALKTKYLNIRNLTFVGVLAVIFTALLSALNLTFEKLIQASEVEYLGTATNKAFPENILELINMNPVIIFLFFGIAIAYLIGKLKERNTFVLIPIALISISIYFLAPTYANKFLIGVGLYSALIISDLLFQYIKEIRAQAIASGLLILLTLFSFINNYNSILTFYKTADSTISALNGKEAGLIKFLRQTEMDCTIVTDPFSQIAITGLTRFETANGQYMDPVYRKIIHNFLQTPTSLNLNTMIDFPGYSSPCFIYSYRFEEARVEKFDMWANQLYSYVVISEKTVSSSIEPIKTLSVEMDLVYKDKYYYVYR